MKIKSSKKFTTRFRQLAFGGEPDEEMLAVHSLFNEKGWLTEEIRVDEDENRERHSYAYTPDGKLLRHDLVLEPDGISESFQYTRDEKGRVTEEIKYYGDDPGERVLYEYGAHEQPVSIRRYDADGEPESIEVIEYDANDRLIEHRKKSPDGVLTALSLISYNENGLPVTKTVSDGKGAPVSRSEFTYNEKNELIRVIEKNGEGKTTSDITTTYDDRGNVIERRIRDYQSRTLRFKFDANNNCIEEEVYDGNGNLTMKSNFEFDEHNNLVSESGYYLDMNRGSQMANTHSRYEYEYQENS